MIHRRKKWRVI